MKVDVLNQHGKKVNTTDLPSEIFEAPIKPDLMHQAFIRQLANARLGTRSTKGRSEVAGGGRKPWRQKGTGRARHGSRRSPIWVGGGKVHTPKPRDFSLQMPKKMRRAALRSALSAKASQSEILVLDELIMKETKTKEMARTLQNLVGDSSALIILAVPDEHVEKSIRNLPNAKTVNALYLNVRDLLSYDRLILPLGAVDVIDSYLGR
ncbi:MAG: 50S ribosomal protein L4 [Chloroflexi bacterium RBG_16_48_8]|nr:MAG: 50S ribosomal protein L4 [Chloroflexi bacterium RBG_16_48_8]